MAKDRQTELAKQVREQYLAGEPIARAVANLIEMQLSEVKDRLVNAGSEDMLRMQGEARQLQRLLKLLTERPPEIRKE